MKSKGFTLIEMLIVIAIIGLLAGIIFFGLGARKGVARDARRITDLKTTQQALELYYQVNQEYLDVSTWAALETALTGAGIGVRSLSLDPLNDTDFYYRYDVDSGGTPSLQVYVLGARLEDTSHRALDTDIDDSNTPFATGFSCDDPIYCTSF
ncbi:MAG: prepilin-type N-terminal cleavage/methylation domain-containing protein [Candidatus Paceibacterota bacterium]